MHIWDKVFKSGPRKICGRQPLKKFVWSTLEYFVPFKRNSWFKLASISYENTKKP